MHAWYDEMITELTSAFAQRDYSAIAKWSDPTVVFDWSRSMNDVRGVYEGVEGLQVAFDRFFEAWSEVRWEITSVEPVGGDRMLALTRFTGRGRDSGIEVDASGAQIWEFRDRLLTRATLFQDRERALADLDERDN